MRLTSLHDILAALDGIMPDLHAAAARMGCQPDEAGDSFAALIEHGWSWRPHWHSAMEHLVFARPGSSSWHGITLVRGVARVQVLQNGCGIVTVRGRDRAELLQRVDSLKQTGLDVYDHIPVSKTVHDDPAAH